MKNEFWQALFETLRLNKGKITGTVIGFIIGLLVLIIGFFKTILILIFTVLGYYIGSRWDLEKDFKKILDRLLPPQLK